MIKIRVLKSFVYQKARAIACSSRKSTLMKGSVSGMVPSVVIMTRKFLVLIGRGSNSAQFNAMVTGESTKDSKSSSKVKVRKREGWAPKSHGLHMTWR